MYDGPNTSDFNANYCQPQSLPPASILGQAHYYFASKTLFSADCCIPIMGNTQHHDHFKTSSLETPNLPLSCPIAILTTATEA
eukprot:scaffold21966_cov36-Cyclotella_meneghiniana.AAC.6